MNNIRKKARCETRKERNDKLKNIIREEKGREKGRKGVEKGRPRSGHYKRKERKDQRKKERYGCRGRHER